MTFTRKLFPHTIRTKATLRNAYKLKRWLNIRNSSNSSYDSILSKNWNESDVENEKTDRNFSIRFKNQKYDIFRNIKA
ncbi:hypothetical protein ALC53_00348 [Atta colombica]|uniref:Uncharacterized protein n=1 Tax=Atta colombica TaxID=520822 RepID=A0A195BXU4_9HYME|nr:hypothetical protein ALC53_00348 [Atta colombica]